MESDDLVDPTAGPDELAERQLLRHRLDAALAALPAEQRDAFLLHEEAGFTVDEIASITEAKRETAKSRLRYAARKIRAALKNEEGTDDGA